MKKKDFGVIMILSMVLLLVFIYFIVIYASNVFNSWEEKEGHKPNNICEASNVAIRIPPIEYCNDMIEKIELEEKAKEFKK